MHDYRDLPALVQQRTSVLLAYSTACVVLLYMAGYVLRAPLAFVLTQLALLAITAYVTGTNEALRLRLPYVWVMAAILVFALGHDGRGGSGSLVAVSLWGFVGLWVVTAVASLVNDVSGGMQPLLRAAGIALGSLGAVTLAISIVLWMASSLLRPWLELTAAGNALIVVAEAWKTLLPVRTAIVGLIATGLLLEAAEAFARYPYRAPAPQELIPGATGAADFLLLLARWPYWLVVVIAGFVATYLRHLGESAKDAVARWAAQAYFGAFSLVGGAFVLGIGHLALWYAVRVGLQHTARAEHSIALAIVQFVLCHALLLIALTGYSLAPALIQLRWTRHTSVATLAAETAAGLRDGGAPAAVAVGKGFSVLGIFLVAAPLAALVPGGPRFGIFSALYVAALVATTPYVRAKVAASRAAALRRPAIQTKWHA